MKRFLRGLGIVMMVFNGIAVLAILFNIVSFFRDMEGTLIENIAMTIVLLLVYGGLFFAGSKLYAYGNRERKAQQLEEKRRAADRASDMAVSPNFANLNKKTTAAPAKPTSENEHLHPEQARQYARQKSNEAAARTSEKPAAPASVLPKPLKQSAVVSPILPKGLAQSALHLADRMDDNHMVEIDGAYKDGKPWISITVSWKAGSGGGAGDTKFIPQELWKRLTSETLKSWIGEAFAPSYAEALPQDFVKNSDVQAWCWLVRMNATLNPPEAIDVVENPFAPMLEDVGPDGLSDESGVALWLRAKDEVDAAETIRAVRAWQDSLDRMYEVNTANGAWSALHGGHTVITAGGDYLELHGAYIILTANENWLSGTPEDVLALCRHEKKPIWVAVLTDTGLRELVTGKVYEIRYNEWPGSADDAATYGEWWLGEAHPVVPKQTPAQTEPERAESAKPAAADDMVRLTKLREKEIDQMEYVMKPGGVSKYSKDSPYFHWLFGTNRVEKGWGASEGVAIDERDNQPYWIVTQYDGQIAAQTWYLTKKLITYSDIENYAAEEADELYQYFQGITAENWREKKAEWDAHQKAEIEGGDTRFPAPQEEAMASEKPLTPEAMKLAFRGFCRRSDSIKHVAFTDHSVESHFYPGGIPRIDRVEDGWTFLGGWDDMRGPTVRDRGLTRDEAMKRLAWAIECECEKTNSSLSS